MKKRLVALVLCVAMLLGCTAVRADADYNYFFANWLNKFDFSESACRSSSFNRSALAALAIIDYQVSVSNAYEADYSQPIYVSNFTTDDGTSNRMVDFFTESGRHVRLFIGEGVVLYDVDSNTPTYVKTTNVIVCDWNYEASLSEMVEVYKTISELN